MDDKRDERFVDELLDASLQRYRSEDPRAGLENRILANVRASDRVAHRRGAWVWAFGAVTAAAILLIVATHLYRRYLALARSPEPVAASKPPLPLSAPRAGSASLMPRLQTGGALVPRAHRVAAPPSRPAQFPTPAPLSAQEKLLLAYVASTPKSELITPVVRDPQIEPLQFPEIKIARIEIKELPKLNE